MRNLPSYEQAYESLVSTGLQFPDRRSVDLQGLGVTIDPDVLGVQGRVYARDAGLQAALTYKAITSEDWEAANAMLQWRLDSARLVWGVSGFATGGINPATGQPYNYEKEAEGLLAVYGHLASQNKQPSLVVDGGVSDGALGLNGLIAQRSGVSTMGFIPKEGLGSVGPRDHTVICDTYEDQGKLVATAADVLLCVAGEEDTRNICQTALAGGSAVMLLVLRDDYPEDSLPNTYQNYPRIQNAIGDGRMVVCGTLDDIPARIETILQSDPTSGRAERRNWLNNLLTPEPPPFNFSAKGS